MRAHGIPSISSRRSCATHLDYIYRTIDATLSIEIPAREHLQNMATKTKSILEGPRCAFMGCPRYLLAEGALHAVLPRVTLFYCQLSAYLSPTSGSVLPFLGPRRAWNNLGSYTPAFLPRVTQFMNESLRALTSRPASSGRTSSMSQIMRICKS